MDLSEFKSLGNLRHSSCRHIAEGTEKFPYWLQAFDGSGRMVIYRVATPLEAATLTSHAPLCNAKIHRQQTRKEGNE